MYPRGDNRIGTGGRLVPAAGLVLAFSVLIAGCSSDGGFSPGKWIGKLVRPDEAALSEEPVPGGDKPFPNLSVVPSERPKTKSTAERDAIIRELEREHRQSISLEEKLRQIEQDMQGSENTSGAVISPSRQRSATGWGAPSNGRTGTPMIAEFLRNLNSPTAKARPPPSSKPSAAGNTVVRNTTSAVPPPAAKTADEVIRFAPLSTGIRHPAPPILQSVAERAAARTQAVRIVGYGSMPEPVGARSQGLAIARSEQVAARLIALGVEPKTISIANSVPQSPGDWGEIADRVEIFLEN